MPTPKLTAAERARVRELMEDEAMTRQEAVADVLAYGLPAHPVLSGVTPCDCGCTTRYVVGDGVRCPRCGALSVMRPETVAGPGDNQSGGAR